MKCFVRRCPARPLAAQIGVHGLFSEGLKKNKLRNIREMGAVLPTSAAGHPRQALTLAGMAPSTGAPRLSGGFEGGVHPEVD
jgi:hypothetical protein